MNRGMIDSGVEWIGKIPSTWDTSRIGAEYKVRNEKVSDKNYMPLSVTKLTEGIVPQMDQVAKSDAHDDRKLVLKGDFVINSRSDRKMSCGVSNYDGSVSLINIVLEPVGKISTNYTHYLLKNYAFAEEFYKWGHGIVADLWTTNSSDLKRITIPVPSGAEQHKIVETLDRKISQIDKLIANQEKQIEKLKDYKQSLITKVMTKGLNPNAVMKDSGEASIGFVPVHWNLLRSKFIFNEFLKGAGISKDEVFEKGDIQCVRYGEIYTKYDISFKKAFSNTIEDKIPSKVYLEKGDIIFSATGELVEEIGKNVVYLGEEKCLAGGDIIVGKHSENAEFLNYAMYCSASQIQKSRGKAKLKVVHISATNIGNVIVSLPPIKEQIEIVEYLNKKMVAIDKIISLKNKKIDKLRDYKKSIIYEYVTGKKEVTK